MSGRNKFQLHDPFPSLPFQLDLSDWKKIDFVSKPIESEMKIIFFVFYYVVWLLFKVLR